MNMKMYTIVSSSIFALVALLQLLRIVMQWDVMVDGRHIPYWASFIAVLVAGFLSFIGFRLLQQIQKYLT